jgi:hypothetical protein
MGNGFSIGEDCLCGPELAPIGLGFATRLTTRACSNGGLRDLKEETIVPVWGVGNCSTALAADCAANFGLAMGNGFSIGEDCLCGPELTPIGLGFATRLTTRACSNGGLRDLKEETIVPVWGVGNCSTALPADCAANFSLAMGNGFSIRERCRSE